MNKIVKALKEFVNNAETHKVVEVKRITSERTSRLGRKMIKAEMVFDGINQVNIPTNMGTPTSVQMQGTPYEQLGELALRVCYESLGYDEEGKPKGRSSAKSHAHILETKNHSVYEHINFTIAIYDKFIHTFQICRPLLNRKGVHIELPEDGSVQITYNPRVLLDWGRHLTPTNNTIHSNTVFLTLYDHASKLIPQILQPVDEIIGKFNYTTLDTLNRDQQWISMYLSDSRSWSHEQVRHRFAMSQRSTRYVDESESDYVPNPDIEAIINDPEADDYTRNVLKEYTERAETVTKVAYNVINTALQTYYTTVKGMEGTPARKRARGAARDYLCNALQTEMIYSAPINGWRWIIENRNNPLADSRMRSVYSQVKTILKESVHGEHFSDL